MNGSLTSSTDNLIRCGARALLGSCLVVSQFLERPEYLRLFVGYRGSADRLKIFLTEFGQMFAFALLMLALLMRLTLKSWRSSNSTFRWTI